MLVDDRMVSYLQQTIEVLLLERECYCYSDTFETDRSNRAAYRSYASYLGWCEVATDHAVEGGFCRSIAGNQLWNRVRRSCPKIRTRTPILRTARLAAVQREELYRSHLTIKSISEFRHWIVTKSTQAKGPRLNTPMYNNNNSNSDWQVVRNPGICLLIVG